MTLSVNVNVNVGISVSGNVNVNLSVNVREHFFCSLKCSKKGGGSANLGPAQIFWSTFCPKNRGVFNQLRCLVALFGPNI